MLPILCLAWVQVGGGVDVAQELVTFELPSPPTTGPCSPKTKAKTCSEPPLRKRRTHGLKCDRRFANTLAQEGESCASLLLRCTRKSHHKCGLVNGRRAAQSLQPAVDQGLELLAAELDRIPHRIESSGLRLRKTCSRQTDKAWQLCWPTLQQLLTGDEANDGLQKVSLQVPCFSRVQIAALLSKNGLLDTRESTPTSAMARHHSRATEHAVLPTAPELRSLDKGTNSGTNR